MSEIIQTADGPVEIGKEVPEVLRIAMQGVGYHLTVVDQVYHHLPGKNPTDVACRFHVTLKSDERPYQRELKVGEEWTPLRDKHCWIEGGVSMFVIQNEQGHFPITLPTEQEKQEENAKVLELAMDGVPFTFVAPLQGFRLQPIDFERLTIRSRSGTCKFTLTVFPL